MVRVWSGLNVEEFDDKHLLGEHAELHLIFSVIVNSMDGYSTHPEVKRFRGYLGYLFKRHEEQVKEMQKRNFNHNSPLEKEKIPENDYWGILLTKKDIEKDKRDMKRRVEIIGRKNENRRFKQTKLKKIVRDILKQTAKEIESST